MSFQYVSSIPSNLSFCSFVPTVIRKQSVHPGAELLSRTTIPSFNNVSYISLLFLFLRVKNSPHLDRRSIQMING